MPRGMEVREMLIILENAVATLRKTAEELHSSLLGPCQPYQVKADESGSPEHISLLPQLIIGMHDALEEATQTQEILDSIVRELGG